MYSITFNVGLGAEGWNDDTEIDHIVKTICILALVSQTFICVTLSFIKAIFDDDINIPSSVYTNIYLTIPPRRDISVVLYSFQYSIFQHSELCCNEHVCGHILLTLGSIPKREISRSRFKPIFRLLMVP